MYYVSWGAMRRRTGQSALLLALALLAAAGAAATPWYGLTVAARAAGAEVTAAPPGERVVTVYQQADASNDPRKALDTLAANVSGLLSLDGARPILGLAQDTAFTDVRRGSASSGLPLAYRDDFCAHAHVVGSCPDGPGTVAISADTVKRIGLDTGDLLRVLPAGARTPLQLRITGVYDLAGQDGQYWADKLFRAQGELDPAFTTLDQFRSPQLTRPTLSCSVPVPFDLLRGDNLYDLNGVLNQAQLDFAAAQLDFDNPAGVLFDRVLADRVTVLTGVLIALAQLLLLAFFALGLAGRLTGRERRADAGVLKLRGTTRGGLWRLAAGQHWPPLAAGALLGLPLGIGAAWLVAGALPVRAEWWIALLMSIGAVLVVLVVGLVVLTLVDALAQRGPVAALLRRIPGSRRDWRSRVIDLAFLVLAAGAVYQARTGGPRSGLGAAAPGLVALAVGLLLARTLRWTADRIGSVALRAGRLRLGLTAVQLSRQPGTDRIFAVLVVAVALLALACGSFAAGRAERADRADVELGAARVLTVRADSRTALAYAVQHADPGGRQAMAAVLDTGAKPALLLVDTARLAAVAAWRPEYGPADALTAVGDLPSALPLLTEDTLKVRLRRDADGPRLFGAILQHVRTGASVRVEFRHLRTGDQQVSAAVPACAQAPGCRLVGWEIFPAAGDLTIRSAGTILDAAGLADVARWHGAYLGLSPRIASSPDGLVLRAEPGAGNFVYQVDAPLPLPIVVAGQQPARWRFDDAFSTRFGGAGVPVRVAGTAPVLPVVGGDGILADLDAANRVAGDADLGGVFQVWLAPGAPPAVLDALRANGLAILGDRTTAARTAALAAEGTVVTVPFELLAVVIALLLATVMIAVVAVTSREPQLAMLRALRAQGLTRRTAVTTGYAGTVALVAAGVLGGLAAALVAGPVAGVAAPDFPDGWRLIPPPTVLDPPALALAAVAAVLVFGTAGWLSVRGLRGGVR